MESKCLQQIAIVYEISFLLPNPQLECSCYGVSLHEVMNPMNVHYDFQNLVHCTLCSEGTTEVSPEHGEDHQVHEDGVGCQVYSL